MARKKDFTPVTRDELGMELDAWKHDYHTQDLQLAQLRAIMNDVVKKIGTVLDVHNKTFEKDQGTLSILARRVENLERWINTFVEEMERQKMELDLKKVD